MELGASVVGLSADPQPTNDAFAASLGLPFPLVGDPAAVKAYGARWPILHLVRRITYVAGRDRRIVLAHAHETDHEGHVAQALAAVESLAS